MSIKVEPCIEKRHLNNKTRIPSSSFSNSLSFFFFFLKFVKEDYGDCMSLEPSSNIGAFIAWPWQTVHDRSRPHRNA